MAGNHMSELSPRQRMINMMYLVLTALLALNISKEVLDAFQKMDDSIDYSFTEKYEDNLKEYQELASRAFNNPDKFEKWNELAKDVRKESESLIQVIEKVRGTIDSLAVRDNDPDSKTFKELKKKDDKEITIKVLIKSLEDGGYGLGLELKNAVANYRESLLKLQAIDLDNDGKIDENIFLGPDSVFITDPFNPGRGTIHELFNTDDYKKDGTGTKAKSWEHRFYGHVPVAAMAFMNQMKMDIVNMEGSILELLQKKTGQSSITVNEQRGVVLAPRQTIMLGDSFKAKVFVAGVDTNQLPKFNIYAYDSKGNRIGNDILDSLRIDKNNPSQGLYSVKPTRQGTYWLGGDIVVQTETGPESYPFTQQYTVEKPMSVISPTKMLVLYTIVDNPIDVSVPGYSSEELTLYSDNSACPKPKRVKNGTYNVVIPKALKSYKKGEKKPKELNLFVKADGKNVGQRIKFRIKDVPDPVASIRKRSGQTELSIQQLMSTKEVKAKTPEWFDFDLAYEITKFNFSYPTPTGSYITQSFNSGKFGADIKQQFEGLATGDVVYFSKFEYKIKGKKGTYRMSTDQPIVITIL